MGAAAVQPIRNRKLKEMSKRTATKAELCKWVTEALEAEVTFFRVRKDLWSSLKGILKENKTQADTDLVLKITELQTLKGFLLSRNDKMTDDKQLAFDVLIGQLAEKCEEEEAGQV